MSVATQQTSRSERIELYAFDHDHGVPARELQHLVGGKGSGLAEMTRALGIPVPPGFTIPLPVARLYRRERSWPPELEALIDSHLSRLGATMGRHFGDPRDPLLVAVRSGAPVSMPGMLDTVLNLGLNDETVAGLARVSGDERFAWDCYRRFVQMFATTVMAVPAEALGEAHDAHARERSVAELRDEVTRLRRIVRAEAGEPLPEDPRDQLRRSILAVFDSWDSGRAKAYRARESIDEEMGTAVNIQAMVFGNRGGRSGTGVVFTRDPSTGASCLYGDYLDGAQGEDVVAGVAQTLPIAGLAERAPEVFAQLAQHLRRLEIHYRDMCDVEFTVEDGRLWLLQTRTGKRSAVAAVKIAADLIADPEVKLTPREVAARLPLELRTRARDEVIGRAKHDSAGATLLTTGLGASPGRATGRIVLDTEAAVDAGEAGDAVILVRPHTSPEDVAGMAASVAILTVSGGLASHAAVVARGWGIPAVVGARDIVLSDHGLEVRGVKLRAGDTLTLDGTTGEVWSGELAAGAGTSDETEVLRVQLPELLLIERYLAVNGQ